MAQRQSDTEPLPRALDDGLEHLAEWGPEPSVQVDLGGDLRAAVKRASANEERLVVRADGEELTAIIPMADFRLLLRLEEEEWDRIDVEEAEKALADPENRERIPLAQIQAEL